MTEEQLSETTTPPAEVAPRATGPVRPESLPPAPQVAARSSGWTPGRVVAVVVGSLMTLASVGFLGAGGTALWADLSHRDAAGYVTSDVHTFSTGGSALATDSVELGDPGVGWLYSEVILGEVRIRVRPSDPGSQLFVGIGPTADVDRYLGGVSKTVIQDIWTDTLEASDGGTPASPPGTQDFWVASEAGTGPQTIRWDPVNGSWTVVVMNVDGAPSVNVSTDLGATMPTLMAIAIGSLAFGALFLVGGVLLIVGAIRRSRASVR
jgi:hypothetical protein